ncbi:AIR synthase-related protein [Uliginosibacterium sp. TH139]|uniref:AIR synthase-related protein n=1 Tax=Uliginosibacterium sp. TH139 TaxID=2067453 RepID=UPI00352F223A
MSILSGTPIMALAIVDMPLDKLPPKVIGKVLEGDASICREVGFRSQAGVRLMCWGRSMAWLRWGGWNPTKCAAMPTLKRGSTHPGLTARSGGLSAALKKERLDAPGYAEMVRHTTQLNRVGPLLVALDGVHAITNVTDFGLAGHLLEICRGSPLAATIEFARIPRIASAEVFACEGLRTGASPRNWKVYGQDVRLPVVCPDWQQIFADGSADPRRFVGELRSVRRRGGLAGIP